MSHCHHRVRHFVVIGAVASCVLLASHHMLYCALVSSSSLPPSPHVLHHYCPMHLIPITSRALSPLPYAQPCHCCHPTPLIAIALHPSSLMSCSPCPIAPHHLWPMRPKDDGRGFFSVGWGNRHEGIGIEILEVLFIKVRHRMVFLFSFRRLTFFLVVCAGRDGTSCAWSRTTESQAAPW
jgi:hypothetical protein